MREFPWATFCVVVLTLMAAVVGGIVVILGNLSFSDYLNQLSRFVLAVGLIGIGRGLGANAKQWP